MNILFAILFTIALIALIFYVSFFKIAGINKYVFASLFLVKLLGGIAVYTVYTYYYDPEMSDIHKFYRGGEALYDAASDDFTDYLRLVTGIQGDQSQLQKYYDNADHWTRELNYGLFNDNRTIMRFNAIVMLFSRGNIFIHIVLMAFLSFIGSFVLFKGFLSVFKTNKYLLLFASFLVPSCWFWTSGLMKEGLMMLALGFSFYFLSKLYREFSFWRFIGFILSLSLMFTSKIYVLPAFLPAVVFLLLSKKMNVKYQLITFFSLLFVSAIFVVFSGQLLGFDIISTLSGKQNDFINYIALQDDPGSTYDLTRLSPDIKSFLLIIPEGLLNSFFRPFPSEINSAFMLFSFLEILLLLVLMIFTVILFNKPDVNKTRIILFSIMFVLFLYVVIGVYTPNTGSIVRYRTPALPFIYAILFSLIDLERVFLFVNKYRNK